MATLEHRHPWHFDHQSQNATHLCILSALWELTHAYVLFTLWERVHHEREALHRTTLTLAANKQTYEILTAKHHHQRLENDQNVRLWESGENSKVCVTSWLTKRDGSFVHECVFLYTESWWVWCFICHLMRNFWASQADLIPSVFRAAYIWVFTGQQIIMLTDILIYRKRLNEHEALY